MEFGSKEHLAELRRMERAASAVSSGIVLIDAGWGDWRLGDDFHSRLTQTQADALRRFGPDAEAGTADVRFGDQTGEIIVFEGEQVYEVGEGGTIVDVTPEGEFGYARGVDVTATYAAR